MSVPPLKPDKRRKGTPVVPAGKDPSWRSPGWAPTLDAASLCDYLSDVVLATTRDAIAAGERPSGGPQVPLNHNEHQGERALAGLRPDARGEVGGRKTLSKKIRRSKMRVTASGAKVVIRPGAKHRGFVTADSKKRGSEYFSDDGKIAEVVEKATARWLEAAIAGQAPRADTGEKEGDDV